MSGSANRIFKIIGIVVLILGAIIISASYIVGSRLEETVKQKLLAVGFHTKSVSISFLKRSIELERVYYAPPDTTIKNAHTLFIQKINVSGVHIYSLLKKQEIIIDHLVVDSGSIRYNKNYKIPTGSPNNSPDKKINGVQVKHFFISNIDASLWADTLIESSATLKDFELNDFNLSFKQDTTYSIGKLKAKLENIEQSKKGGLHAIAISKLYYNSKDEQLEVDSLRIIPNYNKGEFARIARIQKTRLDITLPKIIFEGVKQDRFFSDSTLEVTRISIPEPIIHAYRDKRYPFVRDWIMPLPIEGIRRLPFTLKVDSILIYHANIAYEEYSEKGLEATGTITFNTLDASFAGLNTENNQPDKKAFCTLVADCKVMNNGVLHATFKFPLNDAVNYEAYGSVRNMDLKSLNPALGNLARIEISEGTLNELHFNFSYNDAVSTGEVLINYSNLKLGALKKEKVHEVNKLLSTAINAIVKSDKDKSVDKSERTGAIDIERDKKRFVFQLWWKSVLDGLQSTFLDSGKKKKTTKGSSK